MDHVNHAHLLIRVALAISFLVSCGGDAPGCWLTTERNGNRTLHCPDGSTVPLGPEDGEEPYGTLRGSIRRFGYDVNDGIQVKMKGVHVTLETDADGSWEVRDLPVGWYGAEISHPGYQPVELAGLPVLPGIHDIAPIELKIGVRLIEGDKWSLIPSPAGTGVLAFEPEGRLLWIDPRRSDPLWLGNSVRSPTFTEDGGRVVYLDDVDSALRSLKVFDTDTRTRTVVAEKVVSWQVGPRAETLVYSRDVDEGPTVLETWNHLAQKRTPIAQSAFDWTIGPEGRTILARVGLDEGTALIVWDVASETGLALPGSSAGFPAIGPDGRSFIYRTVSGQTLLWHGGKGEAFPIEPPATFWSFSTDGSRVLVGQADGTLEDWALGPLTRRKVAAGVQRAVFSPDGRSVAYVHRIQDGRQQIRLWSEASGHSIRIAEAERLIDLAFGPEGSRIFWIAVDASGSPILRSWSLEDGVEEIGPSSRLPTHAPDGSGYVYTTGTTLWYRRAAHGAEAVELLEGVNPNATVGWFGRHVWATTDRTSPGPLHVVDRERGELAFTADLVFPPSIQVTEAGFFFLDDCNETPDRGRLIRWKDGETLQIHTGVRLQNERSGLSAAVPATFSKDGRRGFYQSDLWPERSPRILALYDDAGGAPTPIDSHVIDAALGEKMLVWVVDDQVVDSQRSGLYLAPLPLATRPSENPIP